MSFMLSVTNKPVMHSVVMPGVVMPGVVMPGVVMLNVVAPLDPSTLFNVDGFKSGYQLFYNTSII